jgi:hypothetical protein
MSQSSPTDKHKNHLGRPHEGDTSVYSTHSTEELLAKEAVAVAVAVAVRCVGQQQLRKRSSSKLSACHMSTELKVKSHNGTSLTATEAFVASVTFFGQRYES